LVLAASISDAGRDDQLTVIAQDHDVAITKIGEEARSSRFRAARPHFVISNIAGHLQRMPSADAGVPTLATDPNPR